MTPEERTQFLLTFIENHPGHDVNVWGASPVYLFCNTCNVLEWEPMEVAA